MKMPTRKVANVGEQRRFALQAERAKAATVRSAFPQAGVIHIDLSFAASRGNAPSSQRHSLYPSARAFFRFACPCADCDGNFDLTAAVAESATAAASTKRSPSRSSVGRMLCQGSHWRDSTHSDPCHIELDYRVVVAREPAQEPSESAA